MKRREGGENCIMKLRDMYSLPSVIRMIKSRRMKWKENVARMGGEEELV
jgi:hypothetical protein